MFEGLMKEVFFGNAVSDYLLSLLVFAAGVLSVKLFKRTIVKALRQWSEKSQTKIDDFLIYVLEKKFIPILYFGVFYMSLQSLNTSPFVSKSVNVIAVILISVLGIRLITSTVEFLVRNYWMKDSDSPDQQKNVKAVLPAIKVVVWGLGIVFLLDNLGFEISAVIAGLGIGGIAVALASQAVLGDLFSYFSIMFDRPFEAGDFIIAGDYMGTVEHVGIKTTRIQSLGGEQIVFSNTDITNSRLRNYKKMQKRRVLFSLGVTYQTTSDRLKEIPSIIREIVSGVENTAFDRTHFFSFGDFSLVFEVVYYVMGSDYNKYMDIQETINLRVKEEFEKRGIEFAYPTQTLYVPGRGEAGGRP